MQKSRIYVWLNWVKEGIDFKNVKWLSSMTNKKQATLRMFKMSKHHLKE